MKRMIHKSAVVAGAALASGMAMAEDAAEGLTTKLNSDLVTTYITDGKDQIIAVLTAGAVIIGAFYIWRLIKKALSATK